MATRLAATRRPHTAPAPSTTDFAVDVFGYLPRTDQRQWAHAYLRGLLDTPGKKTVRQMAKAVTSSPGGAQALQQFISASPWDWTTAREMLARKAADALPQHVWTVGTAVEEKRGNHSVGVHRRFVPRLGRTLNCRIGVGLFLTSAAQSIPVDWTLLLDETWTLDEERRRRARIPDDVASRPVWADILHLVDRAAALRLSGAAPLVVDLGVSADVARLTEGLAQRERDFVVEVRPDQPLVMARPDLADATSAVRPAPLTARRLLDRPTRTGRTQPHEGIRHLNATSSLVRLAGAHPTSPAAQRTYRLIREQGTDGQQPSRFWITSMPKLRAGDVLALTRRPLRTAAALRELESDFGMLDFEGRSFPGWHHHMTLTSAAYTYGRLRAAAQERYSA
jgi:hypothetical protein